MRIVENPIELSAKTAMKAAIKAFQNPASAAAMLLALLIIYHSNFVSAASGGRMGGRAFHSPSPSPSPSSRSTKSSIRSRSASRSSSYCSTDCTGSNSSVVFEFSLSSIAVLVILLIAVCAYLYKCFEDEIQKTTSVIKLQIGIAGIATLLQKDLNLIAESADTSNPNGLHYLLTETIATVLRHCDHCISCYSLVDVKSSREEGEKGFNQLSIEERGKFDEETLVNFNNIKKWRSTTIQRNSGFNSKYIVITIVVAVGGGVYEQARIHSSKDLKQGLQKLSSILLSQTLAVEVLWTPQKENDTLSEQQLLRDYPLLQPLY